MNPKRILVLDHSTVMGGAERYMLDIIEGSDRKEFEHIVATASDEIEERMLVHNVEYVRFDSKRLKIANPVVAVWRTIRTLIDIKDIMVRKHIDVVLTNTVRMHIVGVFLALITGKKLVWVVHSYDFNRRIFRALSRVPCKILFVSKSLAGSYMGKAIMKCDIIYNGINWDAIQRSEKDAENTIANISGGPKIGIIGRIEKEKGHEDFVRSIPAILEQVPEARFLIVGRVNPGKKDFKEKLIKLIIELHIEDKVHFIEHVHNIFPIIARLDVVVQPSRIHESFGRVLIEAMAMGKPVVATEVNGYTEIIRDGHNGVLVPVENPMLIAKSVINVIKDKGYYDILAAHGKETIEAKYNVKDTISQYSAFVGTI